MTLVFLLEEPSMQAFLAGLLPRVIPETPWQLIPHEGKQDLEKSLPRKLKAWQDPHARFVVIRDQDSGDCRVIKDRLRTLCETAQRKDVLIRIACRELEAWFLADLAAVDAVYGTKLASQQQKAKFRTPDVLGSPSRELAQLVPTYGKIAGARALGPLVDLDNTRSKSFEHLIRGIRRLVEPT